MSEQNFNREPLTVDALKTHIQRERLIAEQTDGFARGVLDRVTEGGNRDNPAWHYVVATHEGWKEARNVSDALLHRVAGIPQDALNRTPFDMDPWDHKDPPPAHIFMTESRSFRLAEGLEIAEMQSHNNDGTGTLIVWVNPTRPPEIQ